MKDYRALSPCERVAYYQAQIRRLTPPASSRERLLIAAFEQLVHCAHGDLRGSESG